MVKSSRFYSYLLYNVDKGVLYINEIWTVILTSSVVTALINIGWKYYENKNSFRNAKYMQISNYYRESSGKEMHRILESWTEMLFLLEKPEVKKKMGNEEYLTKLLNDTYLYSSPETCTRLAKFQQYNYTQLTDGKSSSYEIIILTAGIIVSLKHDFTGDWVSVEETLRIKINDYEKLKNEIKEQIKKHKY